MVGSSNVFAGHLLRAEQNCRNLELDSPPGGDDDDDENPFNLFFHDQFAC